MTGRRAGRSATARNQASSPPKGSDSGASGSPPRRRTTRSQSVSLGESTAATNSNRVNKRSKRQSSVESVGSNASVTSSRNGRTRAANRGAYLAHDLSIVAERDSEPEDDDVEMEQDDPELPLASLAQSPGGGSQMSGTTVRSAMTSRSDAAVAALDELLVERLSDLYSYSSRIVNQLVPANPSMDTVTRTATQLRIFGSQEARRLRLNEESFKVLYERFLSKGDTYIRIHDVLRKFLGGDYGEGDFRPDAILQLANMATMVKDFLVNDRESQTMRDLQFFLNRWFPEAFVTSFGAFSKFGSSTLLDESFDLALNVRTQYAISELLYAKESDEWDPELIVSEVFYDNETQTPKNIMGNDTPNSPDQTNFINERVESIRSAFNGPKGQDQGDLVDFDNLQDELFPWPAFLTDLVSWTRQRADEIISCVRAQGGPDVIQENLSTMMPAHDTQDNIEQAGFANEEPQDPAPVDITGDMPSKSHADPRLMKMLAAKLKNKRKLKNADSNAPNKRVMVDAPRGSVNSPELGSSKRRQIPQSVVEDLNLGDMEDDEDLPPLAEAMAKSAMAKQVTGEWNSYQQEINKENRPVQNNNVIPPVYKKKFNDKNHQGQKVGWETQELESTAPRGNASKQNQEESEPSEDEGFQSDRAAHEPERRVVQLRKTIGKSRARGSSPEEVIASASNNVRPAVQVGQSRRAAKAQTVNEDDEEDDSSRNSVRRQGNVKASRPAARPQTVDEDEDDEEDVPPPTVVEVQDLARMATSQSKRPRVQTRTPWSEHDEQHLIDLIAKHGTSWSLLYKLSHFDRETTDVGLKDKARNLRAAWEKTGVTLPVNFNLVRLSKKEVDAIRNVRPDFDQDD